jgi:type I restriction enzyme S subunit
MAGWKRVKIEDVFEETCEKNHPYAEVLTIIQGVGTVPREQSGREIVYDKNSLANYKFVKKGDFIIHLRSFEGGLEVANSDGIVSPAYIILHPKIEVSTIYLYALFHTNRFINQTMAPAVEGARDGRSVKYDVLKKQKIPFPPLSEQKKIAEILATQDRVIVLKEKLIAEKQSQKKYLSQMLLTGKKRVGDYKDHWEYSALSNYLTIKDVRQIPNDEAPLMAFIAGMGVSPKGERYDRSFLVKNDKKEYKRTDLNDFIYSSNNLDVGSIGLNSYGSASISVVYEIFAVNSNAVPVVLSSIIQLPENLNYALRFRQGAIYGQYRIYAEDFLSMKIKIPTLPEQKAIADVLSAADEEISLLQKDLEQEKLKKKSLMQLLLTGLVRVQ